MSGTLVGETLELLRRLHGPDLAGLRIERAVVGGALPSHRGAARHQTPVMYSCLSSA